MSIVFIYIESVAIGLAYGFIIGYLKYAILWKKQLKSDDKMNMGALYLRLGIGYAINVSALLFVFLLRHASPLDFAMTIIAAAVAMSMTGKLAPMNQIVSSVTGVE